VTLAIKEESRQLQLATKWKVASDQNAENVKIIKTAKELK